MRDREQEQIKAILEQIEADAASERPLQVKLDGDRITVTMPGTQFAVTYRKPANCPHLVLTHNWLSEHVTTPAVAEFRARAFQAAVDKARELGWIV